MVWVRLAPACAMVALPLTASVCSAEDGDGAMRGSENQPVASNQSASIDEAIPPAPPGITVNPDEEGDESADPAQVQPAGEEKHSPPTPAGLRRLKQARMSERTAGHETPWYRSGLGALAIVLSLVGAATWVLRRWMAGGRISLGRNSGVLRIVGRTPLSPKHSLALIQLGRRFVMVGVAGDRVNTLCEVSDPEEVAELAARTGTPAEPGAGRFDDLLLGEAADYRKVLEEEVGETRRASAKGARAREPLTDLLSRLRTLQAK